MGFWDVVLIKIVILMGKEFDKSKLLLEKKEENVLIYQSYLSLIQIDLFLNLG